MTDDEEMAFGRLAFRPLADSWRRMVPPVGGNLGFCRWCGGQMTRLVVAETGYPFSWRSPGTELCPDCDTGDWDDPLTVDSILSTPSVL